ncbi:hypothetical protein DMB66_52670 [Actinoplanes sp. ATCC 53533]|uniref:hypothetical protein n=1 Tax=Actinoplanes sp. ATCC 53533 TaxID=1288362 RepID=UPI000F77B75B|nr:hypothetical protein [Actinoplanes sp. ATCC 53533]RSM44113.1 hypothetical protein DMB66_52670 [Actinoplanes sp. ATCC 53533]
MDADDEEFVNWLRQALARINPEELLALVMPAALPGTPVACLPPARPGSALARAQSTHAIRHRHYLKTLRKLRVLATTDGRLIALEPTIRTRHAQ